MPFRYALSPRGITCWENRLKSVFTMILLCWSVQQNGPGCHLVISSLSYILGGRLGPDSESFKGLYQMLQCYSEIGTKAQPLRGLILGRQLPKNILGWSSGESQVVTGLGMDLVGLGRSLSEVPQTIKSRLPFFLPREAVIECIPILSNHVKPSHMWALSRFPTVSILSR